MRWIVFAVLALASVAATAGTLDINLSNDTIEAKYDNPFGAADWTFGGLYNRDDKNYLFDIGLLAAGEGNAGKSRVSGGLGGKVYAIHVAGSDVAALADHLKIERFAVIGVSGGGPHAAACARFLPDRVTAAGLVSGVGPIAEPGLTDSMEGFNRGLIRLARTVAPALLPLFALQEVAMRRWPDKALQSAKKRMAEPDAALLNRPDVRAVFLEDARLATGSTARAATQDFELFVRDWGFRLADIEVPVHVWHGDLDKNVPFSHGEYVAEHVPGARFYACPGEGHLLVVDHLGEILGAVSVAP